MDGFTVGVNLPWLRYGGDFGRSAWHPRGGLSQEGGVRRLDEVFSRLEAHGLQEVRWFLFGDGATCEVSSGKSPSGSTRRRSIKSPSASRARAGSPSFATCQSTGSKSTGTTRKKGTRRSRGRSGPSASIDPSFWESPQLTCRWGWGPNDQLRRKFPTRTSAQSPEVILESARRAGYSGAFGWSMLADDDASDFSRFAETIRRSQAACVPRPQLL